MNVILRAPVLCEENVLREIHAGDDSLLQLAETFDVDLSNFTLRRVVRELVDRKLIRVVLRKGQKRLVPAPAGRRAAA